jgi:hypothetical protein
MGDGITIRANCLRFSPKHYKIMGFPAVIQLRTSSAELFQHLVKLYRSPLGVVVQNSAISINASEVLYNELADTRPLDFTATGLPSQACMMHLAERRGCRGSLINSEKALGIGN